MPFTAGKMKNFLIKSKSYKKGIEKNKNLDILYVYM